MGAWGLILNSSISIVTIVRRFVIESFHLLEMLAEFYFKKENKTAF